MPVESRSGALSTVRIQLLLRTVNFSERKKHRCTGSMQMRKNRFFLTTTEFAEIGKFFNQETFLLRVLRVSAVQFPSPASQESLET